MICDAIENSPDARHLSQIGMGQQPKAYGYLRDEGRHADQTFIAVTQEAGQSHDADPGTRGFA